MKRAGIHQIAELAGVSIGTVEKTKDSNPASGKTSAAEKSPQSSKRTNQKKRATGRPASSSRTIPICRAFT